MLASMQTRPAAALFTRPVRLRPQLRPRSPGAGRGDARVEKRIGVPRDIVAGIEVASRLPRAVESTQWQALTGRLERHVMRHVPAGARGLQVTLDEGAFEVVLRYRLGAARGASGPA